MRAKKLSWALNRKAKKKRRGVAGNHLQLNVLLLMLNEVPLNLVQLQQRAKQLRHFFFFWKKATREWVIQEQKAQKLSFKVGEWDSRSDTFGCNRIWGTYFDFMILNIWEEFIKYCNFSKKILWNLVFILFSLVLQF